MQSPFSTIELLPYDPILGVAKQFNEDPREIKVNLGIGTYKTNEGASYLFKSVHAAEKILLEQISSKDYLPIEGEPLFLRKIIALTFGNNTDESKVFALQSLGGTGALSLAAIFLHRFLSSTIAISTPSWLNHVPLFKNAGFDVHLYPYYKDHHLSFEETFNALKKLPSSSIILLQTACHNPTGTDFSKDQWQNLLDLVKTKQFFPLFDNSYQGLGNSVEDDSYAIRLFHENGIEMAVTTGCSKNFGLYGERVGAFIFSLNESTGHLAIMSQLRKIIRSLYSSPPMHGAKIVTKILDSAHLRTMWIEDLATIKTRIQQMRTRLAKGLNMPSLERQQGFFSLLGINEMQVLRLKEEKGIYLPSNGRINIAGLTTSNLDYVIESLKPFLCT